MMYQEKLVLACKHNGRVLREQGDAVLLPFGAEYSLFFKNLNSVRAMVRVSIDGIDATEGCSRVIAPNDSIELERFIVEGNMNRGHRFKFIERTQQIEDGPRGIRPEDGLIRVEFEFERQPARYEYEVIKKTYVDDWKRTYPSHPTIWWSATPSILRSTCTGDGVPVQAQSISSTATQFSVSNVSQNIVAQNTAGITVPGSISEQTFTAVSAPVTDGQKHVMVLRLVGQVADKKVSTPITVKTKQECPTCGTKNKAGTKFCRECGTSLTLL